MTLAWSDTASNAMATNMATRQPCWRTNVGMLWLRVARRHTACKPHHMTVGVTYAMLSGQLAVPRTATNYGASVTAVPLSVVRPRGTVYQLHFN